MAIDIVIGRLAVQRTSGEIIKRVPLEINPNAPLIGCITGQSNALSLTTQQFKDFVQATGLRHFFNDPTIGLLRESRQSILLLPAHRTHIDLAISRFSSPYLTGANLYRDYLAWFAYWIEYALTCYPSSAAAFSW